MGSPMRAFLAVHILSFGFCWVCLRSGLSLQRHNVWLGCLHSTEGDKTMQDYLDELLEDVDHLDEIQDSDEYLDESTDL
jgi:hypothetical protein